MSALFPAAPDSYLQSDLAVPVSKAYPLTIVGKVKMVSNQALANLFAAGSAGANRYYIRKESSHKLRFVVDSAPDITMETTQLLAVGEWYFYALVVESLTSRSIYLEKISDGTSEWIDNTTTQTAWSSETIDYVSIGSGKNIGGAETTLNQDQMQADTAIIDGALTEAQCTILAQGGNYEVLHTPLKLWLTEDPVDWSSDVVDSQALTFINSATGTDTPAPTYPPSYSADHPSMDVPVVAPVLTNATATAATTVVDGSVHTSDGTGTIYASAFLAAATPTHADIKAGTGALGSGVVSKAVSSDGTHTLPQITGLTDDVPSKLWFTQENGDTTASTPVSDTFEFLSPALSITFEIITDVAGTVHPDGAVVSYAIYEGLRSESKVEVYSGEATISSGHIYVATPDHLEGDDLIVTGDITDTDITSETAKLIYGVTTVVI